MDEEPKTSAEVIAYCGWYRVPGRRWRQVVNGDTADQCRDNLHLYAQGRPELKCDMMVLPYGSKP